MALCKLDHFMEKVFQDLREDILHVFFFPAFGSCMWCFHGWWFWVWLRHSHPDSGRCARAVCATPANPPTYSSTHPIRRSFTRGKMGLGKRILS